MAAIALVVALFAAACGTDSTTVESSSVAGADQTEASSSDDAAAAPDVDAGSEPDSDSEPVAEGPVPVADHEFPDLGTVNIVDGSAVNLADQLAGGDTPVLLWFWAPH